MASQDLDPTHGMCQLRREVVLGLASIPLLMASIPSFASNKQNPALAPDGRWNPKRSWFFCMALVEWADADTWAPFPKKGRKDLVLRESFRKIGVPDSQIVMVMDKEATRKRVRKQLIATLSKAQPGDFLWFHYSGHGWKGRDGMYLVPYDNDGKTNRGFKETAYKLSALLEDIEQHFRGSHALLTGDCCHSGQMAIVAPNRKGPVSFGAITSSLSSEVSTGNWTFTNSLIDGLTGYGPVDLDRDGGIDLSEIAKYSLHAMAFEEEQLGSFDFASSFPKKTDITKVLSASEKGIGRQVEVQRQDTWQKAIVSEIRSNGDVRVRIAQTEKALDKWFPTDRIREFAIKKIPKGTRVEVKLKGKWIKGTVLAEKLGIHHVRFDGEHKDDDEWVSSKRIRVA